MYSFMNKDTDTYQASPVSDSVVQIREMFSVVQKSQRPLTELIFSLGKNLNKQHIRQQERVIIIMQRTKTG